MKSNLLYRVLLNSILIYILTGCVTNEGYHKVSPLSPAKVDFLSALNEKVQSYCYNPKNQDDNERIRTHIASILDQLQQLDVVVVPGEDIIKRASVFIQAMAETLIAERTVRRDADPQELENMENSFRNITVEYYTKLPVSPLCQKPEATPSEMAGHTLESQASGLKTLQDRKTIVRDLAEHEGNIKVELKYLRSGLQPAESDQDKTKRTKGQIEIFNAEVAAPKNRNLVNMPLPHQNMPDHIVGASLYIERVDGNKLFFGINSSQATHADNDTPLWRLWLGAPSVSGEIQSRVDELATYEKTGQ